MMRSWGVVMAQLPPRARLPYRTHKHPRPDNVILCIHVILFISGNSHGPYFCQAQMGDTFVTETVPNYLLAGAIFYLMIGGINVGINSYDISFAVPGIICLIYGAAFLVTALVVHCKINSTDPSPQPPVAISRATEYPPQHLSQEHYPQHYPPQHLSQEHYPQHYPPQHLSQEHYPQPPPAYS
ncbi:hypothetical protein Hamer_G022077 [Homarus americanus]|uniref:Uncharacterized protein n=1 Tax=Homarus americanus TaxID=6706 RepID=A0A8J5NA20_HOMAM|nr:hypothetical protein Hamer_G022077 [Homarus americanus]